MKALILFVLIYSPLALSRTYDCEFDDSSSGKVKIVVKGKKAAVTLDHSKRHNYKNCKAGRDDFGILIDCSSSILDFMVLINDELSPATGGIMSSTHDFFVDIDC